MVAKLRNMSSLATTDYQSCMDPPITACGYLLKRWETFGQVVD